MQSLQIPQLQHPPATLIFINSMVSFHKLYAFGHFVKFSLKKELSEGTMHRHLWGLVAPKPSHITTMWHSHQTVTPVAHGNYLLHLGLSLTTSYLITLSPEAMSRSKAGPSWPVATIVRPMSEHLLGQGFLTLCVYSVPTLSFPGSRFYLQYVPSSNSL